jgi:iron complex transport system ATP-binding protein
VAETPALKLDNVSCGYGSKTVIHSLSLQVAPGEIAGIVGPNGCGKSTLLKAAAGTLPVMKGRIYLHTELLTSLTHRHRAQKLTTVAATLPRADISVFEYVSLGRTPYHRWYAPLWAKKERDLIEACLHSLGIHPLKNEPLHAISSGEKQLAQLGRAFIQNTSVLLLDEPISHLDINHQTRILHQIRRCAQEGTAVLIVLHDLSAASAFCDSLYMMKNGRIHTEGSPGTVITHENITRVFHTSVRISGETRPRVQLDL